MSDKIVDGLIIGGLIIAVILVIIVVITVLILYSTGVIEGFSGFELLDAEIRKDYETANKIAYKNTIFERATQMVLPQEMICNLIPITPSTDCNLDKKKPKFAVHIIPTMDHGFLAVFNDGKLYKKQELTYPFWSGPLENSMPDGSIPLRMATLDVGGKLLGVGFDNILYSKMSDDPESTWQRIPNSGDIIYVMFQQGTLPAQDTLIAITVDGFLVDKSFELMGTTQFKPIANDDGFPVLKIWKDKNGFLLGLGADFKMYRKATQDWRNSEFDTITGANPSVLIDAVYDYDGRMYGMVMVPKIASCRMMKQKISYYLSQFIPTELMIGDKELEKKLSKIDIVKLKTGIDFSSDRHQDIKYGDLSLEEAANKLKIEEMSKVREHCATRGLKSNTEYENYEFLNKLETQQRKIGELNDVLAKMIEVDPSKTRLQESN